MCKVWVRNGRTCRRRRRAKRRRRLRAVVEQHGETRAEDPRLAVQQRNKPPARVTSHPGTARDPHGIQQTLSQLLVGIRSRAHASHLLCFYEPLPASLLASGGFPNGSGLSLRTHTLHTLDDTESPPPATGHIKVKGSPKAEWKHERRRVSQVWRSRHS